LCQSALEVDAADELTQLPAENLQCLQHIRVRLASIAAEELGDPDHVAGIHDRKRECGPQPGRRRDIRPGQCGGNVIADPDGLSVLPHAPGQPLAQTERGSAAER
jgi:hypothetical protein